MTEKLITFLPLVVVTFPSLRQVKGGVVRQGGTTHHSMEVSGPVLPHTVHQLTALLAQAVDTFTLSLCPVPSSLPFALHSHREATSAPQVKPRVHPL